MSRRYKSGTKRYNSSLSAEVVAFGDSLAQELGISRSELIELALREVSIPRCPACNKAVGVGTELIMAEPSPMDLAVVCSHCGEEVPGE